jgi:WD40 repeat protein
MKAIFYSLGLLALLFTLGTAGCTTATPTALPSEPSPVVSSETVTATSLPSATSTRFPTLTPVPSATLSPTPKPTLTRTATALPLLAVNPKINATNVTKISQKKSWGLGKITAQTPLQNGKLLMVSTAGGLHLYDSSTKKRIEFFSTCTKFELSPDQQLIVIGCSGKVVVYDLANFKLYKPVPGTGVMMAAGFSGDNKLLAVVHSSLNIDIVRLDNMEIVTTLTRAQTSRAEPATKWAAFSPDNQFLLTAETGGLVYWNLAEKKFLWYVKNTTQSITSMPFSSDGKFFLTTNTIYTHLRETRFGNDLLTILGAGPGTSFSPDGKLFVVNNKGVFTIYTVQEEPGVVKIVYPGDKREEVSFSNSSSKLVVNNGYAAWVPAGVNPGTIQPTAPNIPQISPGEAIQLGHFDNLAGFSWGKQGELWVWGSIGNQAYVWDASSEKIQTADFTGTRFLTNIIYHSESQRFAACTDKGLEVISLKDKTHHQFSTCIGTGQIAFSPDGTQIARTSALNTIDLINAKDGSLLHQLIEHTTGIYRLIYSADGKWLAAIADAQISLWQLDPLKRMDAFHGKPILGIASDLAIAPDGQWLIEISNIKNYTAHTWRVVDGSLIKSVVDKAFYKLALSPDGKLAVMSTSAGAVSFWSVPDLVNLGSITARFGEVIGFGFNADGSKLISIGKDGIIRLWAV